MNRFKKKKNRIKFNLTTVFLSLVGIALYLSLSSFYFIFDMTEVMRMKYLNESTPEISNNKVHAFIVDESDKFSVTNHAKPLLPITVGAPPIATIAFGV